MKFRDLAHPLRPRCQERRPEMLRTFFLAKARTRNDAYACGVQQAEAVQLVGLAAFFVGLVDGAMGKGDGGEEIHRPLD